MTADHDDRQLADLPDAPEDDTTVVVAEVDVEDHQVHVSPGDLL